MIILIILAPNPSVYLCYSCCLILSIIVSPYLFLCWFLVPIYWFLVVMKLVLTGYVDVCLFVCLIFLVPLLLDFPVYASVLSCLWSLPLLQFLFLITFSSLCADHFQCSTGIHNSISDFFIFYQCWYLSFLFYLNLSLLLYYHLTFDNFLYFLAAVFIFAAAIFHCSPMCYFSWRSLVPLFLRTAGWWCCLCCAYAYDL